MHRHLPSALRLLGPAALLVGIATVAAATPARQPTAERRACVKVQLSGMEATERADQEESRRRWWARLMNITSPAGAAWVAMGLLGQALFTGRMVVQWLISERHRRSIVPAVFWWLSLAGATTLLVYFVWRRDVVGVLGQAFGWAIYVRNLWLIHRPRLPYFVSPPATAECDTKRT